MKNIKIEDNQELEEKFYAVGIHITLTESLVNFLESAMHAEIEVKKTDMENLTIVLRRTVKLLKSEFDKIENIMNL